MLPKIENQYRVFLSYAHADAQTEAGKNLIASFKEQINAVLQSAAGEDLVFLDSEALDWGNEWSSKITECLHQCKVFVCLLSPNYQQSAYCKRERLMWERKEIRLGRLRKGTQPVYYIRLDNEKTEELLISQADDSKPFFENIEQIREDIIAEKIDRVKKIAEKIKNKEFVEEQASSVKFGFLHISPNFVGRLGELSELCEICSQRHIPIVTGEAGVGKSELVVAYASGYAERYPQGRFMLHMEGVEDWNHAVVKLVEDNSSASNSLKDLLELPEDYDKLPLDEKRKKAVQSLWKRSQDGRLLLILDNLDKLNLVSDNGLNKLLDGVGDLPENVDIIATSRNNNLRWAGHVKALSGSVSDYIGLPVLYEIDNLDTASAFELFCRINDDQFPFAKCNPEYMKDDVRDEYDALMEIISYLKGHAWSLEIIAALMAENTDDEYTFQCKLEEIRKTTTGIAGDDSSGNLSPALTPEQLLQPTFDRIAAMDRGCKIGVKILELATVAAFFPPDMVSDEALLGYWKKYYTEFENVGFDAGAFALKQLHALHLINGEGGVSKMHRLTRDVLLERQSEEDKLAIVKKLQVYWDEFHDKNPNITMQEVQPWAGWADEWLNLLSPLQKDEDYLWTVANIADESKSNNLYIVTERLYRLVLDNAQKGNNELMVAIILGILANLHSDLNRYEEAENEYVETLNTCRRLAETYPERYDSYVAWVLSNFAIHHMNLNRYEEAKGEFVESLKTYRRLAEINPACYDSYVAWVASNFAILHSKLKCYKEAESEFVDALNTYRRLTEASCGSYDFNVALTLTHLANLHSELKCHKKAEGEFVEALSIRRYLAETCPGRYDSDVALTLSNLANLHSELKYHEMAEGEFVEALEIYRNLVKTCPDRYDSYMAATLNNIATLHSDLNRADEAEREYKEALSIRRRLAEMSPDRYYSDVAMTLNDLANLHSDLNRYKNAEGEYVEALSIRRRLAEKDPEQYDADVAETLNNIATFHSTHNCYDLAMSEQEESLSIYQALMKKNPDYYASYVAGAINNIANLHAITQQSNEAEKDYEESLTIYRSLADKSPNCYNSDVAMVLFNFALYHNDKGNLIASEEEFNSALSIFHDMTKINPARFNPDVIKTENMLAKLHENANVPFKTDITQRIMKKF